MKHVCISAAVGCVLVLGSAGAAWSADPRLRIDVRDLDLASNTGAAAAIARVEAAAREMCHPAHVNGGDLGRMWAQDRCVKATMDQAVAGLRAPMVSRVYQPQEAMSGPTFARRDALRAGPTTAP